jgi:hypothetical protein
MRNGMQYPRVKIDLLRLWIVDVPHQTLERDAGLQASTQTSHCMHACFPVVGWRQSRQTLTKDRRASPEHYARTNVSNVRLGACSELLLGQVLAEAASDQRADTSEP